MTKKASTQTPRKALLLAAGYGSRLNPLTLDLPKPLFPCRGETLIGRLLHQVESWGVREVCVNLHHRSDRMLDIIPGVCPRNLVLNFSFEPHILGTGGPLRRMEWFLEGQAFWMCNADIRIDLDPTSMVTEFKRYNPLACLWMVEDKGPKTVKVLEGKVVDFRSKGLTFSGLHLISPRIMRYVPENEQFCSVIDLYDEALRNGEEIRGVEVKGSHWADLGEAEHLVAENGGSVILPGALVENGVKLSGAVVGEGVRLRKGRYVSWLVASPARGLSPEERTWLPKAEAVEFLPSRGSDRSFRRVHLPKGSRILMKCGEARPENYKFSSHTSFLKRNRIPVPSILEVSRDGKTWLLEDLGRVHLLDRLASGKRDRNQRDEQKALHVVAHLHGLPVGRGMTLEPAFSPRLFAWEKALFYREFLSVFDPGTDPGILEPSLRKAARLLGREPQVLLHRDLQSTNFMWTRRGPVLIDYQGMRLGPAAYDLASFLADPYVDRSLKMQFQSLEFYNSIAKHPISEEIYRAAAVQRLCQTLGAYGRLGRGKGTERFLEFIAPALRQLRGLSPFMALTEWAESLLLRHPTFTGNRA